MIIKQNLVPTSKYSLKCPYPMTPIGLCIHNTANDASARGEISYMVTNSNQTSFHLAVDDIEVWQGLPLNRNGWHAGDGNGNGNRKHIGIEICYSKNGGERFNKAEDNAVKLISQLLSERGWKVDRVRKHQDFSGKYCPHRTLDLGWDRFINKVKAEMGEIPTPIPTMPYQTFHTKFTESFRKHKDTLPWGDDKHKFEALGLTDTAMIGRMIDSLHRDYNNKLDDINNRNEEIRLLKIQVGDRIAEIASLEAEVNNLSQRLAECQNSGPDVPVPPINDAIPNEIDVNNEHWVLDSITLVEGKLRGTYIREVIN